MKIARACVLLRPSAAYNAQAFRDGFRRIGYTVVDELGNPGPQDVVLTWNRNAHGAHQVRPFEVAGARIVVAENGYLGKDDHGGKLYALALDHHAGAGRWKSGDANRWKNLGIDLAPWRSDGDHIVVLAQRCIGESGVAMPEGWPRRIIGELASVTRRRVQVREHPGVARTDPYEALRGAWAAVTWGSGAGLKSLVAGIPVFHGQPSWIGAAAARPFPWDLEDPFLGDRLPMLERLAWAQWSAAEIASGEALSWLLS